MTTPLLLGSNNKKKRGELATLLEGLSFEVMTPADLGGLGDPVEDGDTFEANARIKAFHYARASGLLTLADDSGIVVDALDGRPGIFSSRYAGEEASDRDNCEKLLEDLAGVPDEERTARFMCAVVVARGDEVLGVSEGRCEGRIIHAYRGAGGFGYDPLFFYGPEGKTFAELGPEIKNRVSHRACALKNIRPLLERLDPERA